MLFVRLKDIYVLRLYTLQTKEKVPNSSVLDFLHDGHRKTELDRNICEITLVTRGVVNDCC